MSYKSTILITGGTSGLGYQAALKLARQNPDYQIVTASRSDPSSSANKINTLLKQKNTLFLPLDLSSLKNVRSFVKTWETTKFPPIKALLLNAALQFPEGLRLTDDGVEATFAVNHVGHALLFHLLLPHLEEGARIVLTASGTHDPAQNSGLPDAKYTSGDELAHPKPESASMDGRQRYATSKLVNIMWMYALQRHLLAETAGRKLHVLAFDPGLMPGTGLAREYSAFFRWIWKSVMPLMIPIMRKVMFENIHTPKESGENLAWVAINGESGKYFEGKKEIQSSVDSYNEKNQEELWVWTVKNVSENEVEAKKFGQLR